MGEPGYTSGAPPVVAEWVEQVLAGHVAGTRGGEAEVTAAREHLGSVAEDLGSFTRSRGGVLTGPLDPFGGPGALVLGDASVGRLLTCGGLALGEAVDPPGEVTWPMFRGRALDVFVSVVLFSGPVADAVGELEAVFEATGAAGDLELLRGFTADPSKSGELAELAAHALAFRGLQRWEPRVEVGLGARFAGVLELRGRADLVLGGPGTQHPCVLVEVKSGELRDAHRAQLRHYVLLASLRNGTLPAGAALWSPVGGLEPMHVSGSLLAAAERIAAGASHAADILDRGGPVLRPGPHCRFCSSSPLCPEARVG